MQRLAATYTVSTPAWELRHQCLRCRRAEACPLPLGSRASSVSLPRRGQRPLPFPLRIEDELPLVSAAGPRGPGLRTEGRGQGGGEREPGAMAGPAVGVAGACFAQGHGGAWEVGRAEGDEGRCKGNGARRLGSRKALRPVAPPNFSARKPVRAEGRSGGGAAGPATGFQFLSSLEPFLVTIHC